MIIVEHNDIELDYCTNCSGVWFDIGELEVLLEPVGQATRGSIVEWAPSPPAETPTPVPDRVGFFDGLEASAAAVGQGNLRPRADVLVGKESGAETVKAALEAGAAIEGRAAHAAVAAQQAASENDREG